MVKGNDKIKFIILGICALSLFFCLAGKETAADSESEITKKIEELEEKARAYQQIIDIKQKQQTTLNNQVSIIDTEIEQLETEIDLNKNKIEELNLQVDQLRNQISEKENIISGQKKILAELIQIYYEYSQRSDYPVLLDSRGLAGLMSESDQLAQTSNRIKEMMNNMQSLKDGLEKEKESIEKKKKEATDFYYEQQERSTDLESTRAQKEVLISQTQGEENRYQDLLARVEAQKQELLGDLDELYGQNSAEIDKLAAGLDKPDSGLASTSWYYSQKDKRWANTNIGQSDSLIKNYGCALTSVAMIFTYYGETVTPATLAKQKIYYWDLIVWPDGNKIKLIKNTNHAGVSWSEIDRELDSGHPVIVFVRAKSNGAGHYVVIHHRAKDGDYVVHDPYWGANIYLSSTMKLLGAVYGTSVSKSSIDQMILYGK